MYDVAVKAKKQQQQKERGNTAQAQVQATMGIKESFAQMEKYNEKSKRWKQITDADTIYLAKNMAPSILLKSLDSNNLLAHLTSNMRYLLESTSPRQPSQLCITLVY